MLKKRKEKNPLSLLNHFKTYSHLCHLNTTSIARGVAIGLFTACIPLISFQTILIIILSTLMC